MSFIFWVQINCYDKHIEEILTASEEHQDVAVIFLTLNFEDLNQALELISY